MRWRAGVLSCRECSEYPSWSTREYSWVLASRYEPNSSFFYEVMSIARRGVFGAISATDAPPQAPAAHIYIYMFVETRTHSHTHARTLTHYLFCMYVCMNVCVYACVCIDMYRYTHTDICIYVWILIRIYTCIRMRTHLHTCTGAHAHTCRRALWPFLSACLDGWQRQSTRPRRTHVYGLPVNHCNADI